MKFRVISDVHNEFYVGNGVYAHYDLQKIDGEKEMCLLMAGDIGLLHSPKTFETFLDEMCQRHKIVFWVEGNHEYYKGNIDRHSIRNLFSRWDNLYTRELFIEDEKIAVVGCTLWSDFNKGNPLTFFESNTRMSDFHLIRKGSEYSKFKAENAAVLHHVQKRQLKDQILNCKLHGYKVIVVTHHHPSFQGVLEYYKGDSLNGAYCSDLHDFVKETSPDYWACGHIHGHQTYEIYNTRVVCNPVGYPGESDVNFDPEFYIDM